MFGKTKTWAIVALATILSMLGVTSAFAATPVGTGSDNAMAPAAGWVQINPGQQQWYTFQSGAAASDATDQQIMARLTADPQGSVNFRIWTPERLAQWAAGDTAGVPIGQGTLHPIKDGDNTVDLFNGDLVWVGRSNEVATYNVEVWSSASSPSHYKLQITGDYLSFPATIQAASVSAGSNNSAAPLVLPSTGQNSQVNQAMQAKPAAGSGPANALTPDGQTRMLDVGQQQWYAFQYAGPDANGNKQTESVILRANPGTATFSVWTPNEIHMLAVGDPDAKSIGAGTLHQAKDGDNTFDRFGGNLEWAGAFGSGGTYYIQVLQTGSAPSSYSLQVGQQ